MADHSISILGCGNIGLSIAHGLVNSHLYRANQIILTKRNPESLEKTMGSKGYQVTNDNFAAVKKSKVVIVCVTPAQLDALLEKISGAVNPKHHVIISVVSGASIDDINAKLGGNGVAVVRAMPNTAIQHCQSMTCLAVRGAQHVAASAEIEARKDQALALSEKIFNVLGTCIVLKEEQIVPATALCACGIAFFCRAIRAASQGGIEIGFHAEDAIKIAAQTAKGAATLLLEGSYHPEYEIDKVTTPQGCTIAGLNQMEHSGFSSAMIKGIVTSAEKAASLYNSKKQQQQQQHHHHHQQPQQVQQVPQVPPVQQQQPQQNHQQEVGEKKRSNRNKSNSRAPRRQPQEKVENQSEQVPEQQQPSNNTESIEQQQQPQQQQQQQPQENQPTRRGRNNRRVYREKEENPFKKEQEQEQNYPKGDINNVDEALTKARSRQNSNKRRGYGRHQNGRSGETYQPVESN